MLFYLQELFPSDLIEYYEVVAPAERRNVQFRDDILYLFAHVLFYSARKLGSLQLIRRRNAHRQVLDNSSFLRTPSHATQPFAAVEDATPFIIIKQRMFILDLINYNYIFRYIFGDI
jgi:hypothetical protein